MAWDKQRPDGTKKLNLIDNDLRENHAQLEAALDLEHAFATGATQDGRHAFGVGTNTGRGVFHPSPVVGNLWLNTKDFAARGWLVLQVHDGIDWRDIDRYDSALARHAVAQDWTKGQVGSYVTVTPGAGVPDTFDWDIDDGNKFKATLGNDTVINNPTGTLLAADNGADYTIELTNDGVGSHTVTFGTNLLPMWGVQPAIDQGVSAVTQIFLTLRSDQKFTYVVARNA